MRAMQQAQTLYASGGITTVQEGLLLRSMLPMYEELLSRGLLTLDVVGYPSPQDYGAFAEAFPKSVGAYDRHFRGGHQGFCLTALRRRERHTCPSPTRARRMATAAIRP